MTPQARRNQTCRWVEGSQRARCWRAAVWGSVPFLAGLYWLRVESPRRAAAFALSSVAAAIVGFIRPPMARRAETAVARAAERVIEGFDWLASGIGRRSSLASRIARPLLVILLMVLALGLFAHGVALQSAQNIDRDAIDQSAYLHYARALDEHPERVVADRNRMPMFPFLLAITRSQGVSEAEDFEQAKRVGIAVSALALVVLAALAWRLIGVAGAATVTAAAAFGMVMVKAPWAQADVLWYLMFTAAAVASALLLQRPSAARAATVGVLLGLAQLSKPGALPLLALITATCAALALRGVLRRDGTGSRRAAGAALVVVFFGLVVAPYAWNSQRTFGAASFNYVSSQYAWYDDADDLDFGVLAEDPGAPRPASYIQSHSLGEILQRLGDGLVSQARVAFYGSSAMVLVIGQVLIVGSIVLARPARSRRVLNERLDAALFLLATIIVYLGAYAWYAPIGLVPRYGATLYFPFLLATVWFADRVTRGAHFSVNGVEISCRGLYYVVAGVGLSVFAVRASFGAAGVVGGL